MSLTQRMEEAESGLRRIAFSPGIMLTWEGRLETAAGLLAEARKRIEELEKPKPKEEA